MGITETSNEIAAYSSKGHDDRGININKIYLQMGKMCKVCGIKKPFSKIPKGLELADSPNKTIFELFV